MSDVWGPAAAVRRGDEPARDHTLIPASLMGARGLPSGPGAGAFRGA